MKKLLIITLFLTNLFVLRAQNLKIYMPDWKTTSAEEVLSNANFHLPYSPTYEANRCANPSLFENYKYDARYTYPVLMPLLIVADVPAGGKNVTWNINDDNVQIIAAPKGSQFISKNHVVTPVNSGKITIENPYRIKIISDSCDNVRWVKNCNVDVGSNLKTSDVIKKIVDRNAKTVSCKIKDKKFIISSGQTYVVVLASMPTTSFVSASVDGSGPRSGMFLLSKIHFKKENLLLTDKRIHPCKKFDYTLVVSGGPVEAPITIGTGQNNEVKIRFSITNTGNEEIDLSKVVLQYKPNGAKKWFDPFILCDLKGKLDPQETKDITRTIQINDNILTKEIGNLTSRVYLFYPTAPENGKYADIHVSYIRKEQADLAGIRTRLDFAGINYRISVINTTPALTKENNTAIIKLLKVLDETGDHLNNSSQILSNGQVWNDGINKGGTLKIKYLLYVNNKRAFNPTINLNK